MITDKRFSQSGRVGANATGLLIYSIGDRPIVTNSIYAQRWVRIEPSTSAPESTSLTTELHCGGLGDIKYVNIICPISNCTA